MNIPISLWAYYTSTQKCEDDVWLIASNEQDLQMIFDNISGCISEYGMKVSERKSKVVCINGVKKDRRWNFSGIDI